MHNIFSSPEIARCSRCHRTPSIDITTGKSNMVQYGLNQYYCSRCAGMVGYYSRWTPPTMATRLITTTSNQPDVTHQTSSIMDHFHWSWYWTIPHNNATDNTSRHRTASIWEHSPNQSWKGLHATPEQQLSPPGLSIAQIQYRLVLQQRVDDKISTIGKHDWEAPLQDSALPGLRFFFVIIMMKIP
jgi:hypothetical protein